MSEAKMLRTKSGFLEDSKYILVAYPYGMYCSRMKFSLDRSIVLLN
jgi:hypothetical protein